MAKNKKKIVVLTIVVFFVVYLLYRYGSFIMHPNLKEWGKVLRSYGKYSPLIFIILYSLKPLILVIPTSAMSILAGRLFGPWLAFIYTMLSCFFSSTIAFYLARYLGKDFVDKLLKGKSLKFENDIEKYGFQIMFLMRLSFVFPFDPLSYAAGLSRMKYKDFILGTMIGIIPEMFAYSFIGKHLEKPFSVAVILPIVAVVIIAVIASSLYKKHYKGKKN